MKHYSRCWKSTSWTDILRIMNRGYTLTVGELMGLLSLIVTWVLESLPLSLLLTAVYDCLFRWITQYKSLGKNWAKIFFSYKRRNLNIMTLVFLDTKESSSFQLANLISIYAR
ncbi:unnamed protein product [Allacma fusca]|uniref:Uncharacterized protein n=1 Tax=Allacma fusca TaxID=39272 RepID=A0A8J2K2D2_9HEXA|nr:unnamed protein product [Allacma fusca]